MSNFVLRFFLRSVYFKLPGDLCYRTFFGGDLGVNLNLHGFMFFTMRRFMLSLTLFLLSFFPFFFLFVFVCLFFSPI